ncbi:hypothetical protein [Emticicia sp. SJ17W-69]|uniref:hypothetical protein n=1 Tax=Emticicia sp. SJ17W-69 TaxID=3421657 RepID=UPI003EBBD4D2
MNLIDLIFPKNTEKDEPSRQDILNDALDIAMEFGKNWLMPIQERLKSKYPFLSENDLNSFNSICKQIMNESNVFVANKIGELVRSNQNIEFTKLKEELDKFLKVKQDWIDDKNIIRLLNQAMYYAYK